MGILVYRDLDGCRTLLGRIDYRTVANPVNNRTPSANTGSISSTSFAANSNLATKTPTFTYDPSYLKRARQAGELGISELLPLDSTPYSEEECGSFFRGLLPEGQVLGNLANLYQVPRTDYFTLIEEMGCESIGALTFISEAVDPQEYQPHYEPVTNEVISSMKTDPARMATITASSTRLSLAGAQSKIAWFLPEGVDAAVAAPNDWLIPCGTAPSTHIIKISRKGEEDIATNELACSLLARACGIETAHVVELPSVPGAICVERYDRIRTHINGEGTVVRLHQEDFCQALGFAPFFKYQPEGTNANYPAMAANLIMEASQDPQVDKLEFAKRLMFCYAIGNTDAHLKNFSLLYNKEWTTRRLAPLYDVTCIPLTGYSTAMPFEIGYHRNLAEIDERDITVLAADMDLNLDAFDSEVKSIVETFEAPLLSEGEERKQTTRMIDRILENARPRIQVLRRFIGC